MIQYWYQVKTKIIKEIQLINNDLYSKLGENKCINNYLSKITLQCFFYKDENLNSKSTVL